MLTAIIWNKYINFVYTGNRGAYSKYILERSVLLLWKIKLRKTINSIRRI